MQLVNLKDEFKKVLGIVAECDGADIRFVRYYVNKYRVYTSKTVAEATLDVCYSEKIIDMTEEEYNQARIENLRIIAEKLFPKRKFIYYQEY